MEYCRFVGVRRGRRCVGQRVCADGGLVDFEAEELRRRGLANVERSVQRFERLTYDLDAGCHAAIGHGESEVAGADEPAAWPVVGGFDREGDDTLGFFAEGGVRVENARVDGDAVVESANGAYGKSRSRLSRRHCFGRREWDNRLICVGVTEDKFGIVDRRSRVNLKANFSVSRVTGSDLDLLSLRLGRRLASDLEDGFGTERKVASGGLNVLRSVRKRDRRE